VLPQKMLAAKASHSTALVKQRQQDQFLLYDQDLKVRIEQATKEIKLNAVKHIIVIITTIVYNKALMYNNNNIRPKHLSFNKFYKILKKTDPNFG
jgi:hypothetical protein